MILDPGEPGESHEENLRRLEALRLPPLQGKRFLDLECRGGFFCRFARFEGASSVIGTDGDPAAGALDQPGVFDVILLTSALHRAQDQRTLIQSLVDRLSPDGILVLELGIARHKVASPTFPSRRGVAALLRGTAWKQMGASARKGSEHVRWQVYHVRRRKPFAYLLLQPPGYGKTMLARELFAQARVHVVSGDETLHAIARGVLEAPPALVATVTEDFSTASIDRTIDRIVERGQARELVAFLVARGQGQDFALDAFLPTDLHEEVERAARVAGYLPIHLKWNRPHPESLGAGEWPARVKAFGRASELGTPT